MQETAPSFVVGIDEAGRGPIAGPVTVGAVALKKDYDTSLFTGLRDSKKLPAHKREYFFALMKAEREKGNLNYAVRFVGPSVIDRRGISYAIRKALEEALRSLKLSPLECEVLLDGSLYAPKSYTHQQTIIRGDEQFVPIMLASVAAKVLRDRKMVQESARYPGYAFEEHKGYGTRAHFRFLKTQGLCAIHRKSFLSSWVLAQ